MSSPDPVEPPATAADQAASRGYVEPFRMSIEEWAPQCKLVYDGFHTAAPMTPDECGRPSSSAKEANGTSSGSGGPAERWKNLSDDKRGQLNELFSLNQRYSRLIC